MEITKINVSFLLAETVGWNPTSEIGLVLLLRDYDHNNDSWFKERYIAHATDDGGRPAPSKLNPVPPYGKRSDFVPRKPEDFGDGGAFPEIHVGQYPLGMGRQDEKGGFKILPITVDAQGKVRFDAVVRQNENASTIVYLQYGDLVPKVVVGEDGKGEGEDDEMEKEIEETAQCTEEALEKIVNTRLRYSAEECAEPVWGVQVHEVSNLQR